MEINFGLVVPIAIIALAIIIIFSSGYRKAPPDRAYIISGLRKKAKVVIGKATIKLPFLERCDILELALMSVDVKTAQAVPTADYINISVDANVNVKISPDPDTIARAQQNFLNKNVDYITKVAREVLEGNMREIVGQMRLEEMVSNRQAFADKVKQNADPDLRAMGLEIVSFNVQNFVDDNGIINDMGIDNSIAIHMALSQSYALREHKGIRTGSLVLCILICLSTMFLKQHSIIDVGCAILLYIFYYMIVYRSEFFALKRQVPARTPSKTNC